MFKLMMCEWLRVKKTVAIALSVNITLLALLIKFGLFNSDEIGFKMSLVLLFGGCGYLFGFIQLKKYTEPSQWTYLVNRPIDVKHVYLALFLTTLIAFLLVVILPFFLATFAVDFWQIEIIDQRHYLQLFYILGIVLSFYLVACFTVLVKKKPAHLLLMLAILPVISLNMGGHVYWLLAGVLAWLFIMVISTVKVNLNGVFDSVASQVTTAIAFGYVLYFIMTSLFFLANEVVMDIDDRVQNNIKDKELKSNSFRDLASLNPQDGMVTSLYTRNHKYADLIEEIKLNQTIRIRKRILFHPNIQQLPFMDENKPQVEDVQNNIIWQFSHDLMLFVGENTINKKIVGYLGPKKSFAQIDETSKDDLFLAAPWVENNQIVVKNKVYKYQSNQQSFTLLFAANEDEYLLNGLQDLGSVQAVITSKQLYLFDSIDYHNDELPLQTQIVMALPGDYNNLWDVKITEVIDRFILSFLYGRSTRHDVYNAQQLSYEFTLNGQIKQLNLRVLQQSPPFLIKDFEYLISPAWKLILDYFPTHPSGDRYLSPRSQMKTLNQSTIMILLILSVIYALITLVLARKRALLKSKKWIWVLLSTVFGLPGLFSFMLLNPKITPVLIQGVDGEINYV